MSQTAIGKKEVVKEITIDDLKAYYTNNFAPNITDFHIAGNVSQIEAEASLAKLNEGWNKREVNMPTYENAPTVSEPMVYFVDIPEAKQSVIQISRLTVPANSREYAEITVANDRLGDGSSGRLFQVLREEKGFTYGAYSYSGRNENDLCEFTASSSVRSNVTKESLDTFKDVIGNYASTYTQDDLDKTKTSMIKENARKFETLNSLINILENISAYDLPLDYINQEQEVVTSATLESVKATADNFFDLNKFIYVIVGDKATQFDRLKVDGPGNPIEVDIYGNVISPE